MNKYLESLAGLSPATLVRGARFGLHDLYEAGRAGFKTVDPLESRELRAIPQVEVGDILGAKRAQVKLEVMKYEDGMLPLCDAIGLLSILALENPSEVLEIGTYMGHTTRAMAENLPNAAIHTVDLPPDFSAEADRDGLPPKDDFHLISRRVVGREYKDCECASRIVQHFGDTAELDFSAMGRPSFFFIDGSHTYEYCRNDSEKCLEIAPPQSTFLWHDCDHIHPGVVRFVSEWRAAGREIVRVEGTALAYWKKSA